MDFEAVLGVVVLVFEAIGVLAMIVGFVIAAVLSIRTLQRGAGGRAAYLTLRSNIGASILLGLEVLVAGDLIRTLSTPTFEDVGVLAIIVLIRTVLSMSLQIEIDGVLPWRRALLTSGGQLLADSVGRDVEASRAVRADAAGAEASPGRPSA
ncbi:MAG: DUF1622 domain-containing protein [Candidatus Leucobacter sulfamidivorax]|nr:DUF1622 domain-containing protein [Candidatus Leucobacter sulfamidivorax]